MLDMRRRHAPSVPHSSGESVIRARVYAWKFRLFFAKYVSTGTEYTNSRTGFERRAGRRSSGGDLAALGLSA